MTTQAPDLKTRLKRGAVILAQLSRSEADRCLSETPWSISECSCQPKRKFCKGRAQWIDLALEDCRHPEAGDLGVFLMMRSSEVQASGLKMSTETEGIGRYEIGPKGQMEMSEYVQLMKTPEVLKTILAVLRTFPGATIQGVEVPKEVPGEALKSPA